MKTKTFAKSRDERKRVEMRFAHLKNTTASSGCDSGDFPVRAMSLLSPPLCRTLKRLRSEPLGRHQPDGAHRMREIAHNWISPVRIKVNASQIAVATAGAAQSEDRSAKQKTTFFDSIAKKEKWEEKFRALIKNGGE